MRRARCSIDCVVVAVVKVVGGRGWVARIAKLFPQVGEPGCACRVCVCVCVLNQLAANCDHYCGGPGGPGYHYRGPRCQVQVVVRGATAGDWLFRGTMLHALYPCKTSQQPSQVLSTFQNEI